MKTEDINRCLGETEACDSRASFSCDVGNKAIPYSQVCDFYPHCLDRSDEDFCQHPPCLSYKCSDNQCIDTNQMCDKRKDCFSVSDEGVQCADFSQQPILSLFSPDSSLFDLRGDVYFHWEEISPDVKCPKTHFRYWVCAFTLFLYWYTLIVDILRKTMWRRRMQRHSFVLMP